MSLQFGTGHVHLLIERLNMETGHVKCIGSFVLWANGTYFFFSIFETTILIILAFLLSFANWRKNLKNTKWHSTNTLLLYKIFTEQDDL